MPDLPETQSERDKLQAIDGKRTMYSDNLENRVRGLALRVSATGHKAWIVNARRPGHKHPCPIHIGEYRELNTLSAARDKAIDVKRDLKKGIDVVAEHRKRHTDAVLNVENTFGSWVAEYLERYSAVNHSAANHAEIKRVFGVEFQAWNKTPIADVTANEIDRELASINKRKANTKSIAGNRYFAYLRHFFTWATPLCETLHSHPMTGLKPPLSQKKIKPRDRTPSIDDLVTLWRNMPGQGSLPGIVRLLILTGARLGEVAGMDWSEIKDGDQPVWRLSAERTKEDKAKDIPLCPTAAAIIRAQPKIKGWSLVFPTSTGREYKKGAIDKPWKRWFASDAMTDVEYFHRHDIRRGVTTGLNDNLNAWLAKNKAGVYVRAEVVEEILGHAGGGHKSGVTATYSTGTYDDERRMALDAWADFLWQKLTENGPDNVVSIAP